MHRKIIAAASIFVALMSSPVNADVYCGGDAPPVKVLTYGDGRVLILTGWRGDFFQVCNLNESWKGVQPTTCFAWMSKLASAINANKRVGIWYGGLEGSSACKTLPTYGSAPAPVYIDLTS